MLQIFQSASELSFKVTGEEFKKIRDWHTEIDRGVFEDQLRTGKFHTMPLPDGILDTMRKVKEEGGILPYFGMGGSSGVCRYGFRPRGTTSTLGVEHGYTKDKVSLETHSELINSLPSVDGGLRFKYSGIAPLSPLPLGEAWTGEPQGSLHCRIYGSEWDAMMNWDKYRKEHALTGRYTYLFGEVSIGERGFSFQVEDHQTGEKQDFTDYDMW